MISLFHDFLSVMFHSSFHFVFKNDVEWLDRFDIPYFLSLHMILQVVGNVANFNLESSA